MSDLIHDRIPMAGSSAQDSYRTGLLCFQDGAMDAVSSEGKEYCPHSAEDRRADSLFKPGMCVLICAVVCVEGRESNRSDSV